ncbi:hypothetical protein [uncultured Nostoc sp.]|uniref:hypothetical protein n=1 Tax=uncultured Nostoc sp. TaxID=340711 RepID=UPI0035C976B9
MSRTVKTDKKKFLIPILYEDQWYIFLLESLFLWEKLLLYLFGFGISDRTSSSTTPEKRSPL